MSAAKTAAWDREVDVLVIGSGAGGLLAGLVAAHNRADVLIVEKGSEWGGSSATSGGGIWIPCSDQAKALGREDSPQEAFTYVRKLSSPNVPDSHIKAFIDNAPEMLRWVTANTVIKYESLPYPDYHVEEPGGKDGYRTHMPTPIDGRLLGPDMATLRSASPAASLFGYINWQFTETYALLFRPPGWTKALAKILVRYYGDVGQRLISAKDRYLTLGNALAGGLRLALKDRGVELWLDSPMIELVQEERPRDRRRHPPPRQDDAHRRAQGRRAGGGRFRTIGDAARPICAVAAQPGAQRRPDRQYRRFDRRRAGGGRRDPQHAQHLVGAGVFGAGGGARAAVDDRARAAGLHHRQPGRQALPQRSRFLSYRRPADGGARCARAPARRRAG